MSGNNEHKKNENRSSRKKLRNCSTLLVRILKRNWAQIALGRIWTWWKRIWFYEDQKTERKMILGALDSNYLARTR